MCQTPLNTRRRKTNKNTTQYVLDNTNTQTLVYDKGNDRHSDNRETYENLRERTVQNKVTIWINKATCET